VPVAMAAAQSLSVLPFVFRMITNVPFIVDMAAVLVAVAAAAAAAGMEDLTEVAGQVPAPELEGTSFFSFVCCHDCFLLADSLPSVFSPVVMAVPAVGEVTEDPMEATAAAVEGKFDSTVLV
jgi:hypothetical protein